MTTPNVFDFENRIDELFETLYPSAPGKTEHPSGRAFKPIIEGALASLVPGGNESRRLVQNREYVKLDFQDFLDFATSDLVRPPLLSRFSDRAAVFYEALSDTSAPYRAHLNWSFGDPPRPFTASIQNAVVARDQVFVTVMMQFLVQPTGADWREECGVTLVFAPERYGKDDRDAGPLGEWEKALWFPPQGEDPQWRIANAGEYTDHMLEQFEKEKNPLYSPAAIRESANSTFPRYGAFLEVARLGLHLSSYVDFMYDLVTTERRHVGKKSSRQRQPRRGKQISFDTPIYKIIRSVRIVRPESPPAEAPQFRQWTAPSYSFLVQGHWRKFQDENREGRDAEGNEVRGKTWVRDYRKFEGKGDVPFETESRTKDPRIVIGVKQTLGYARDVVQAYAAKQATLGKERPSAEWMANERAKLTAGLRYLVLKRDGFRCCKCGKSQSEENFIRLEVDHIVPVSEWGLTIEVNLETLCRECNKGKSNRM